MGWRGLSLEEKGKGAAAWLAAFLCASEMFTAAWTGERGQRRRRASRDRGGGRGCGTENTHTKQTHKTDTQNTHTDTHVIVAN